MAVPKVGDWRPIAVISIWVRVWSRWKLMELPDAFWNQFGAHIMGGLPQRDSATGVLDLMLQLEESLYAKQHTQGDVYWGLLSLDASKCFDKISQLGAMRAGLQFGMPKGTILPLAAFMLQTTGKFSASGLQDVTPLRPTNGLLQGDPLSVVLCNILVATWANQVSEAPAQTWAYIDDRTIAARTPSALERAWQTSQRWNASSRWEINEKKTGFLEICKQVGETAHILGSKGALVPQEEIQLLGYDLTMSRRVPILFKKRLGKAMASATKLCRLHLNPCLAQKVIQMAILPQAFYGIQPRCPANRDLQALRGRLKEAIGILRRSTSWEMICVVAHPNHLLDPLCYVVYTHIMTVVRALRGADEELRSRWRHLVQFPPNHLRHGPRKVFQKYLELLNIHEQNEGFTLIIEGNPLDILERPMKKLGHLLRDRLRKLCLRFAEEKRKHLKGAQLACIDLLRKYTKKEGYIHRAELIAVLADGVWTQRKRHLCGYAPTPTCPCGAPEENLEHLWYDCPLWQHLRGPLLPMMDILRQSSPCTKLCAVPTTEVPKKVLSQWGDVQKVFAQILFFRNKLKMPTTDSGPAPVPREIDRPSVGGAPDFSLLKIPLRPLDFRIQERLNSGKTPWPFSREAWRNLCWWASFLRVPRNNSGRPTTLLEACLSYLCLCQGHRFPTGNPASEGGDRISQQLAAFRRALLSFQAIANSEIIIQGKPSWQNETGWSRRIGLPRLQELARPVILPKWHEAVALLDEFPRAVSSVDDSVDASRVWIRWSPGVPGSQMGGPSSFVAPLLWELNPRTFRGKGAEPQWHRQAREIREYIS